MTTTKVLVTGATGRIGTELVTALRGRDVRVRALVRRPDAAARWSADGAGGGDGGGVETAVADLSDPGAVAAALTGVDAAFLNSPSTPDAAEMQKAFVDAAVAAGVRRVVLLSQLAARTDSPVRYLRWHAEVEQHLVARVAEPVVLRPNLFLQGLLLFADRIAHTGGFGAPIGDARISAIDVRDIAASAAGTLLDAGHAGRTYDLTGPRAVTHAEIADALAAATGSPVTFSDVPPEAFADALRGVLPPWQLDGLLEDYAHYARGEAARVDDAVFRITGRPARDVAEFARDHADAFRAAHGSVA